MAAAIAGALPWVLPGALGGILALAGYKVQSVHLGPASDVDGKTGSSANNEGLRPKPDAFDMDEQATRIFTAAATYRELNPSAYEEALLSTDALLYLERQLATGSSPGELEDMPNAQQYAASALSNFEQLFRRARTGQSVVELEELYMDQRELIRHHMNNVELLLKTIRL